MCNSETAEEYISSTVRLLCKRLILSYLIFYVYERKWIERKNKGDDSYRDLFQKETVSHKVHGPLYIINIVDHKINACLEKFIEEHRSDTYDLT